MIKTLISWRAVFMVSIVLYHFRQQWWNEMTCLGVAFFFMVSGFLMAMHHGGERFTAAGYGRYMLGRARRFYPLHWVAMLVVIGLPLLMTRQPLRANPGTLLQHVLLLQSWWPVNVHDNVFVLNGQDWFLCDLLACYACFPLLARWFHPLRMRYKALIMAVAAAALAWAVRGGATPTVDFYYVFPPARLADFAMGMTLWHLYQMIAHSKFTPGKAMATVIEVAVVMLIAEVVMINKLTTLFAPWSNVLLWWVPAATLILACALLNGNEGLLGRVLLWRPLQWLGAISFEMYVLQYVAAQSYNYLMAPVLAHFGFIHAYDYYLWALFPILIPLAWFAHRLITRRSRS